MASTSLSERICVLSFGAVIPASTVAAADGLSSLIVYPPLLRWWRFHNEQKSSIDPSASISPTAAIPPEIGSPKTAPHMLPPIALRRAPTRVGVSGHRYSPD